MLLVLAALLSQAPASPDSLLAAGQAHFAGKVVGRYAALRDFRAAAQLAPTDPQPLYWQMKVGFFLGMDEGEVIARNAILKILALDPDYQDVWARFQSLYHNGDIWRKTDRALAHHPTNLLAMERRAELAIRLEEFGRADSLLEIVLHARAPYEPAYLLRAEAGFVVGSDSLGYRWYDSALAHIDVDSTDVMWDRVWMIATPEEVVAQAALPADGAARRDFFERFWTKRDPNLLTPHNERIAEHFRRFGHARRYFKLLHPFSAYSRSPGWRALITQTQRDFLETRGLQLADPYPGLETDRLFAATRQLPDVADGAATSSAVLGLDARGLIYLRHGQPDQMLRGFFDPLHPLGAAENPLDVEGWMYRTPYGILSIGFRRASGSTDPAMAGGDFIFVPTNRRQASSTAIALRSDRTTFPAPLTVRAWTASFRRPAPGRGLTDMYFKVAGDSAIAVLWGARDRVVRAVAVGEGLYQVSVPPGRYDLGIDVDSAGTLGRARRDIMVPGFRDPQLSLSSLVLASGSTLLDREATLRAMPATLTYSAGQPLVSYVEIYGLAADREGRSHYRLRYSFAPVRSFFGRLLPGGARRVVFEFDRETPSTEMVERLVIEPGKLPAGRYRVTLAVTDLARNVKSESVALDIEIR